MPECAKKDPESCSTHEWPLPKPLTTPLFPEAHKDVHDFVPAPCFDQNGKFMLDVPRCNPYATAAKAKEEDVKTAAKVQAPLVIPEEKNDRALKGASFAQKDRRADNLEAGEGKL